MILYILFLKGEACDRACTIIKSSDAAKATDAIVVTEMGTFVNTPQDFGSKKYKRGTPDPEAARAWLWQGGAQIKLPLSSHRLP